MARLAIKSRLVFHLACGAAELSADLNHVSCSSLWLPCLRSAMHTQKMCTHDFCAHGSVNPDLFVLNYRKICKVLQISMLICMLLS